MPFNIDPDLPVPLGVQLRGVIEYGIVCGQLQPGERLPPVRSMARQLGIAPMTVSQVYKELKEVGLLETKQGNGTFVSSSVGTQLRPEVAGPAAPHRSIARRGHGSRALRRRSRRPGQCPDQPPHAHGQRFRGRGLQLIFVGLFDEATRAYGADIRSHLPEGDRIQTTTLAEIAASDLARRRARQCRSRAHPVQPQGGGGRTRRAEEAGAGRALHSFRAHPHPARPDRSPGGGGHHLHLPGVPADHEGGRAALRPPCPGYRGDAAGKPGPGPGRCAGSTSSSMPRARSGWSACCARAPAPSNTAIPPIRARSTRSCCPCWKRCAAAHPRPAPNPAP